MHLYHQAVLILTKSEAHLSKPELRNIDPEISSPHCTRLPLSHFTDDKVSQIGKSSVSQPVCSLAPERMLKTMQPALRPWKASRTLSPPEDTPPCFPSLRVSYSSLQTWRRAAQMSQRLLRATARRPHRAQPQPGAHQSLGRKGQVFPNSTPGHSLP